MNNLFYFRYYYWQALFFISPKTSPNQELNPSYDFEVNQTQVNTFFSRYNSTRLNNFNSDIQNNPTTDYYADDLHYLPCFGLVSTNSYSSITQILNNQWRLLYSSTSKKYFLL